MKSALRSLMITTLIVLMCFGMAWLYLKQKANSQAPRKPVPTAYFDSQAAPLIFARLNDLSRTQLKELNQKFGFWIDTQVTRDAKAIVLSDREVENPNFNPSSSDRSPETKLKKLSPRYLTFADIQKAKPEARLLEDVFRENPSRRFIINLFDYSPGADLVISDLITRLHADERIIFHSEQDGPLSDLRKLKPMLLYGTSRAQIVQTLWLASIGLEGIAPLKGDVLVSSYRADGTNQNKVLLTPELLAEARRRSMKVLVGPVTKVEADELSQLGVDGIITSQPQEFSFP